MAKSKVAVLKTKPETVLDDYVKLMEMADFQNYMDISAVIQMLANMPSSNIERIEIITTPPANFDAEGDAVDFEIKLRGFPEIEAVEGRIHGTQ